VCFRQGTPFSITYLIDKGTSPNFTLKFDGVVYAAPYNATTLSGSTALLSGLPLGMHVVTIYGVNPFGTVESSFNFTIESPIINPSSPCPATETVCI
jgi:hypothetical protein